MEDNGLGIAPEDQKRIFRIFERIHPVGKYEGTGIGLAIVQKAVQRMGGRVGVESAPAHGSRFWIELRRPPEYPLAEQVRSREDAKALRDKSAG